MRQYENSPATVFVPAEQGALREALQRAKKNTTLVLSKGVYEETEVLVIDVEGLSIVAFDEIPLDGRAPTTIIGNSNLSTGESPLFHIKAKDFCLRNVCLELSSQSPGDCCLFISDKSEASIENCRISSGSKFIGIEIVQYAKPTIKCCDVVRNKM